MLDESYVKGSDIAASLLSSNSAEPIRPISTEAPGPTSEIKALITSKQSCDQITIIKQAPAHPPRDTSEAPRERWRARVSYRSNFVLGMTRRLRTTPKCCAAAAPTRATAAPSEAHQRGSRRGTTPSGSGSGAPLGGGAGGGVWR